MTSLPLLLSCYFKLAAVDKCSCKAKIQMNFLLRVGVKLILCIYILCRIGKLKSGEEIYFC